MKERKLNHGNKFSSSFYSSPYLKLSSSKLIEQVNLFKLSSEFEFKFESDYY